MPLNLGASCLVSSSGAAGSRSHCSFCEETLASKHVQEGQAIQWAWQWPYWPMLGQAKHLSVAACLVDHLQRRNAQLPLLLSASSPSSDGGLSGPNSPGGGSSAVNDMLYGSLGGHSDSPHSLPHSAPLHAHLHPWWETLTEIGHYGDAAAPNLRKWGVQVAVW
ncbi:hypothetical protein HaLaN_16510, partial [Haematococcus lacustris]